MRSIEIDDDVWQALQAGAEPLIDDPNSVLRRLLGIDGGDAGAPSRPGPSSPPRRPGGGGRAPLGSLLPEAEYELPILEELEDRGGRGTAREITKAVGERLKDRLTDLDLKHVKSGDVRWENRVHFTRLRLRERGLLRSGSPWGTWELTERGRRAAKNGEIPPA